MRISDLLKSNFKHYRFIIAKSQVKKGETFCANVKLGKNTSATRCVEFTHESMDIGENWDIGLQGFNNANEICWFLDKSKEFDFSYMEYDDERETLFIHIERK